MQQPENNNNDSSHHDQSCTDNSVIKLVDLLLALARHWKMIVCGVLSVSILTAGISLTMTNVYTATTLILPNDDDSGGFGAMMMAQLGGLASLAGGMGGPTKAELYVTILKSESIKDPIIDRFKLMQVYEVEFRKMAYKRLDDLVNFSIGKKDGVVTIAVDENDPKRAADMANAYVDELGKLTSRLNMTDAGNNRAFLEKRIAETRADLAKAEDALKNFQSRNKAISVPDQAKATLEGVAQLRAQLAVQEVQLNVLRRQFTDNSQEVKNAKNAIAGLRAQVAGLEGKGSGASSSVPSVGSVPQLGQEYLRLMREFKIQETVLELLTKQYEIAKVSEAKDVSSFKVIQKAKVPERKSKPKRTKMVLTAAFITGLFMVLIALVREAAARMDKDERRKWHELWQLLPLSQHVSKLCGSSLFRRCKSG